MTPYYLSLQEAADYLSLTERTLRKAVSSGELKAHRYHTKLLFKQEDLDRLVEPKEKK
jgi:excisionase family DNA binding protein